MKIVVLAAGYGTRLGLQTLHTPKPLLDLGGVPLLTRLLERLLTAGGGRADGGAEGVSEIVVVSNARFAETFRAWRATAPFPVPVRILDDGTRTPADRLGAIGDLALAFEAVGPHDEDWLVSAGDMWIDLDLGPVAAAFRASRAPRLVVRRVPRIECPSPYNEVTLESERVTGFREKPSDPRTDLAAIALYLLPGRAVEDVRAYLASGGNPDAPGHFIAWLCERQDVEASPLDGEWSDIGSPETLRATRARFASGRSA
ncbi:MAG: nucleotidyltransferase family protein [Myxococcota bacterium]